ncbi:hypothetical protein [Kineococcus rubinsiae]|uniref:hypothetical protein n=1 Tax=Kineococcus rubinsiae TaxID=2609562 RepID=UPI00142FEF14|nr:hypothetical protein [Kineococcus rubinsiae]NIZ91165.1 hypothetical protein [Kineococcus rubinsiae]
MWVLLSSGLRRWLIASIAIPLGAKALGGVAGRIESRGGATKLTRTLRSASSLVTSSNAPRRKRSLARRLLRR